MTARDHEVAQALQLQKLEMRMTQLEESLQANTIATKELLNAWNTSKSTVSFIKGMSAFVATVLGAVYAINRFWGH